MAEAFFPGHCLRVQNRGCNACVAACLMQALTTGPDGPIHDASRCVGCGICATSCPVSVFAPHMDNRHLTCRLADFPQKAELVLACGASGSVSMPGDRSSGTYNAVHLTGCPGALLDATLAACAATGVTSIDCLHGNCGTCGLGNAQAVARARLLWESLFRGRFTVQAASLAGTGVRKIPDVRTPMVSRRSFFKKPVDFLSSIHPFSPLPRLGPDLWENAEHPRLRQIFRNIMQKALKAVRPGATIPKYLQGVVLSINTFACEACGACVRGCPGGALQIESDGVVRTILFTAGLCIGCEFCHKLCPTGAITLTQKPVATEAWLSDDPTSFRIMEEAIYSCARCKTTFRPEGNNRTYCRFCRKKWEL